MSSFYIVRINSTKKIPSTDYKRFMTEIAEEGLGKWDTDHRQTMTVGDYQAFIWGPDANTDEVHIYKVEHIGTTDHRHVSWRHDTPYVEGNGNASVGHREATFLSADHSFPKKMLWSELRTRLGYSENYVPRGNQKVKIFDRSMLFNDA